MPWTALVELVSPHAPEGKEGRPPFPVETMLRIHFMQQSFTLSAPAMEEALHVPLFREFTGPWLGQPPARREHDPAIAPSAGDGTSCADQILALVNGLLIAKGLLLKAGTLVDAALIAAPSATKKAGGTRDPEMHQSKKGSQWFFGMKAHISVDAASGLVHTVCRTMGNVNDVVEANSLLHGQERDVFADAGCQGVAGRPDARASVNWRIALRPGKRQALDKDNEIDALVDQIEKLKATMRAKVEHPFRVIQRQIGHVKVRYRGLTKNTARLVMLFALSNLWMVREKLLAAPA